VGVCVCVCVCVMVVVSVRILSPSLFILLQASMCNPCESCCFCVPCVVFRFVHFVDTIYKWTHFGIVTKACAVKTICFLTVCCPVEQRYPVPE
jgi:hypothetical protein